MTGEVEVGTCDICKTESVPLNRKYYYYDIECECCNSIEDDHFEIVRHCGKCEPKPPSKVTCVLSPIEDDYAFKGKLNLPNPDKTS